MKIVLASHSPRRQELLKGLGVDAQGNLFGEKVHGVVAAGDSRDP